MTIKELARRVEALEEEVLALRQEIRASGEEPRKWWRTGAGRFAGDPVFEEIVRLGREYRESLRPAGRKRSPRTNGDT